VVRIIRSDSGRADVDVTVIDRPSLWPEAWIAAADEGAYPTIAPI
jgi:hypothetical protein